MEAELLCLLATGKGAGCAVLTEPPWGLFQPPQWHCTCILRPRALPAPKGMTGPHTFHRVAVFCPLRQR